MLKSPELSAAQVVSNGEEQRIADGIFLLFRDAGYLPLQDLKVRVDGHVVRLEGRLPSYYLKQKAHHLVMGVAGVCTLIDEIDVVNSAST